MQLSSIGTSDISSIYIRLKGTYYINSLSLWRILRFDNPLIWLFFVSQAVKMIIKVSKFIWQNVAVRYDVEFIFSKLFLHFNNIRNKFGLVSQLITARKVVDFLVFIKRLINIWLVWLAAPAHIPVIALSLPEAIAFKNCLYKLGVCFHHFEQLLVIALVRVAQRFRVGH